MALTQFDLLQYLVKADRKFADQDPSKLNDHQRRERSHERAILGVLADLVRASSLPKYAAGTVGKPRPETRETHADSTPVSSLDEVTEADPEPAPPAPPRAQVPVPAQMAAIQEAGRAKLAALKLQGQRDRAEKMRQAKYAKERARRAQVESRIEASS